MDLKCDACGKVFTHTSNLNRHKIICSSRKKPTIPCKLCGAVFSRSDNLKRHVTACHEETAVPQHLCPICSKKFLAKKTLREHILKAHTESTSPQEPTELEHTECVRSATDEEQGVLVSPSSYSGSCEKCNILFSSTKEFAAHYLKCGLLTRVKEKVVYPRNCSKCNNSHASKHAYFKHLSECGVDESPAPARLSKTKCIVAGCNKEFFHRTRMVIHLVDDHGKTDMKSHEYTFDSISDFDKWKQQVEGDTDTSFTAPCGKTVTDKFIYKYYTCQLEAPDTTHRKTETPFRKTSRKWEVRGCIPKGLCCPARMLVKEDIHSKRVTVNFVESHNHAIDYEHNKYRKVPKAIRDTIIALLRTGVAPKYIKTFLRGRVGALDQRDGQIKPRKEHFIDEVYIRRLKYNVKGIDRYHANDLSSVDILVRCLMNTGNFNTCNDEDGETFSPVTVFKPQGKGVVLGDKSIDLLPNSKDLLLLGIQSREQLYMLQQGAKKVVCIDFTYKVTQYDFYLCNIIVPDEFGKGYPVAHFITNRQDKQTLAEALKSIKVRCPDLEINFLMTDDDQSEWQAMEMVFGPEIRRGICKYHLFRTWQRRLQSKDDGIPDLQLRREVYHSLTVLCHERHEPTFLRMMEAFILKYRPVCENFIKYFVKEYSCRAQVWALCYRNFDHGCTDTNMYCESFHNKIKTFYLERRQNRRVDELIKILLEAEIDRYLEHLEMVKEGRVPTHAPISFKRRHTKGINIPDDHVSTVIESELWTVTSQSYNAEEYYVTRNSEECKNDFCFEKCRENSCSGLCSHLYICTCPDPSGVCKHIHKVHSFMVRNREFVPLQSNISSTDFIGELQHPVEIDNVTPSEEDSGNGVSELEACRSKCINFIDEIRGKINSTTSISMLLFLSNQLRIASGHCNAFSSSTHSHELERLAPTLSVSGPQKVVPYKDLSKFYRTTKVYKGSKENALSKPTFEERQERKRVLTSVADKENRKRIRNMGPSSSADEPFELNDPLPLDAGNHNETKSIAVTCSKPKSLSLRKSLPSNSRSFTPKLGFTNNIHQSVLFFDGQDGTLSSITFRALKSIDPFLSSEECKSLDVTGITGTMPSKFKRGWLFEEVINFFLHSLCMQNSECHYFSTLFSHSLASDGDALAGRAGAFQFDKSIINAIFIPVNITNVHWTLFVLRPKEKKFEFYDPSGTTCSSKYVAFHGKLCRVLEVVYKSILEWDLCCPPHALQTDVNSCGVFVCYYAYCIANKKKSENL